MRLSCKYLLPVVFMLLLAACRQEVEPQYGLQLRLCLPVQQNAPQMRRVIGDPESNPTRAKLFGDPGSSEQFDLPRYAYIIMVRKDGNNLHLWKQEECVLNSENWVRTHYSGTRMNAGDSIYMYNLDLEYLQLNRATKGRVYAICSNKRLTLSPALASLRTLSDVLELKFNTAPDSIQQNLKNIYSTPYNYTADDAYYCSYDCSTERGSYVDMILYHVAAKVDIKWNVVDSMRINLSDPSEAVRLTYMDARRLYNGYAYCFKPLRNTVAELPSSGYDIHLVTPSDEGLWWEGRTYFYTIPYTVEGEKRYFPLQMLMRTNGTSGSGYQLTLNQPIDTAAVFVPWLRGNFNLTKPLEDKSETKTAN